MGRNVLGESRRPQEKKHMERSVYPGLPRNSTGPLLMATADW